MVEKFEPTRDRSLARELAYNAIVFCLCFTKIYVLCKRAVFPGVVLKCVDQARQAILMFNGFSTLSICNKVRNQLKEMTIWGSLMC